jgi:HrpA-like RNA helicase
MAHTPAFGKLTEKLKNLPVNDVAAQVVQSVKNGNVAMLTAETGSGKTLLANSMLADDIDGQVLVLVPRRFLAINAAESVAELAELQLGDEVGYAIGSQGSDTSNYTSDTKLVFATYGYALSSGLIDTAKTIVCDEVHESGIDTSLARALLHRRMQHDPDLRVVEMSATLNAEKQASYWQDITTVDRHHADGKAFPCENRFVIPTEERGVEEITLDLIAQEGRKGIAIFRPGVGEVEKTVEKLRELCRNKGMHHVEVEAIYGDMDMEEREQATREPAEGNAKILVGTNVIESGVNIKWLDTGVSDGKGKVPYTRRNGAEALVLEDLPQWRIVQQEGRVKRFTDGVFVLCSETNMENREQQQRPEIERVSLSRLVMRAASLGIDPENLKYDGKVYKSRITQTKKELNRLGMLDAEGKLTFLGERAAALPLGPEAAATVLAADPEILYDAIELAAIIEVGGLRADYKEGHGKNTTSDMLDGLYAYQALGYEATEEDCERLNISWKRYQEVGELVSEVYHRIDKTPDVEMREATTAELQMLVLQGGVNHVFEKTDGLYYDISRNREEYEAKGSVVGKNNDRFAVGGLREIPGRDGDAVDIVQNITVVPKELFLTFAASREDVLTDLTIRNRRAAGRDGSRTLLEGRYFGGQVVQFGIPRQPSEALQQLIERAVPDRRSGKPRGTDNTGVQELREHGHHREVG